MIAALAALAAPAASAEPAGAEPDWSDTEEEAALARMSDLEALTWLYLQGNEPSGMGLNLTSTAGVGATEYGVGGELSIGAVFDVHGADCSLVQAGALGRLSATAGETAQLGGGLAQWTELCLPGGIELFEPFVVFPLHLDQSLVVHATPRLTAPRATVPGPYTEFRIGGETEGLRLPFGDGDTGVAAPGFGFEQAWQWRHLAERNYAYEVGIDLWFVRFYRTRPAGTLSDRHIDLFAIAGHGVRDASGAAIVGFYPVRVRGLAPLGGPMYMDADLGFAGTGTINATTSVNGEAVADEQVETTGLPDIESPVARLAVYGGSRAEHGGLAYDRTLDATALTDVVLEERISSWIAGRRGRLAARAALFAARAHYTFDEQTTASETIAGASFDATVALPNALLAGLSLEAALPLAARDPILIERAAPTGLRVLATLSHRQDLWHRPVPR